MDATKTRVGAYWNREAKDTLDGRVAVKGSVELHYRLSDRQLVLSIPNEPRRIFRLRLPANPTAPKYQTWLEWRKADFVESSADGRPANDMDYVIRSRIEE